MTEEQLLDAVVIGASGDLSAVAVFLDLRGLDWCIIGGHATDSYAPPAIYSDRLDVACDREPSLALRDLAEEGFRVQVDARAQVAQVARPGDGHRLRVSIHYGPQFRTMPGQFSRRAVLGCSMPVASLQDVVAALLVQRADPGQGWHVQGKAELDLLRLAERYPAQVDGLLPPHLLARAEADREHLAAYPDGDGWGEGFTP